jgi:hypothetical protein
MVEVQATEHRVPEAAEVILRDVLIIELIAPILEDNTLQLVILADHHAVLVPVIVHPAL